MIHGDTIKPKLNLKNNHGIVFFEKLCFFVCIAC